MVFAPATEPRALIVDDEPSVSGLVTFALGKEGFVCDTADNAQDAAELLHRGGYDVVITDLAMPGRNGHSLIVEALDIPDRPIVVAMTGVLEPRLAKDLMLRGIDDIVFKPLQLAVFAAKVRSLYDRRASQHKPTTSASSDRGAALAAIDPDDFQSRLARLTRVPPISKAAIEVFQLSCNPDSDVKQLAAAVQRDPALITDVLRLANSSYFNPAGKKTTSLDQAVVRLGQKRVGELALTLAAFASVTQESVPFFKLENIWRECLASGICVELIGELASSESTQQESLFCTTVMQPVGRVMLASIFPDVYKRLLKYSEESRRPLSELEACVFPESPGEVAAKSLAAWGIPDEIHRPLRYSAQSFRALAALGDPLRGRVELVKTAGLLGKIVAGCFECYDLVDLPPAATLLRLKIQYTDRLIAQCRGDLADIAAFSPTTRVKPESTTTSVRSEKLLAYKRINNDALDILAYILTGQGLRPISSAGGELEATMVVNALDAAPHQVIAKVRQCGKHESIIIADSANAERLQDYGRVIVLPTSFSTLREICESAAVESDHLVAI